MDQTTIGGVGGEPPLPVRETLLLNFHYYYLFYFFWEINSAMSPLNINLATKRTKKKRKIALTPTSDLSIVMWYKEIDLIDFHNTKHSLV